MKKKSMKMSAAKIASRKKSTVSNAAGKLMGGIQSQYSN